MPAGDPQSSSSRGAARKQSAEAKRARGEASCAECRRLKLKCDKGVPCGSCKRRGCSAICPNGSLVTGEGTRFVLASTEKLHQKIARMSDRIRQLEDALTILQSTVSTETHPLLDRELLKIKSSVELHAAINREESASQEDVEDSQYIDAFGTLAIRDDGAATFYGRSAGSESLLIGESANHASMSSPSDPVSGHLPAPIMNLSDTFPWATSQTTLDLDSLVEFLPPWEEACRLSSLYLDQAPWFFGAVKQRQIFEEILPLWYDSHVQSPDAHSNTSPGGYTPNKGSAHDLALLFIIFCFGALTDMNLPAAPDNVLAERYYSLTKAALTIEPVLERPPSVATVQTLSLMAIYEGLKSGENSIESTWALMGVATKLAQSIGLHRDCARWKLPPAEVQKRRALYHELAITDCWQSLATGRLPTFTLPFVDCELPEDTEQTLTEDGNPQPSFSYWKARFGAECVSAVVQGTLTSRAPKYSVILDLDRKVRDIELPKYAQGPPPEGRGLSETMSHFMPTNYRELTLLYIHRCFFAHAIRTSLDPLTTLYAPSFLAGYRSACDLVASIKKQFSMFPAQIARFWVLWTHAFSASVMISSIVTNASKSKVAPVALLELKGACDLFESAASYGGRAGKFLPILRRLLAKAQKVYYDTSHGHPPPVTHDIFRPSSESQEDELAIFSGKTHTLTTTRANGVQKPPPSQGSSASDSPPQTFSDNPAFAGVHPGLIDELHGFDGQINAQLQKAYRADSEGFNRTLMGYPEQSTSMYRDHPPQNEHNGHPAVQHSSLHREDPGQSPTQNHQGYHFNYSPNMHHPPFSPEKQYPINAPPPPHPSRSIAPPAPPNSLSHSSRSYSSLHLANIEHYAPPPRMDLQGYHTHHGHPSPEVISPVSSSHSVATTFSSSGSAAHYSGTENSSYSQQQMYSHQYWHEPARTVVEPVHNGSYATQDPHAYHQHAVHPHHHASHDGTKGMIAVEDHSVQETWQNYMHKVASPRLMFEE